MKETVAQVGEFELIRRLDAVLGRGGAPDSRLSVGIGDDAAAFLPPAGRELLVTCDCMVEGQHYLPQFASSLSLGRRAMAINISDIGAMGGSPLYAVVSLGLRPETSVSHVEQMYRGFLAELLPFGAAIIGGNVTRTDGANFVDITLIGEAAPGRILRRTTARFGDAILVTGFPGQARAGLDLLRESPSSEEPLARELILAYLEPVHRAREGRAVAEAGGATAMIDTSDGLLGDLGHLCEESRVGAELDWARLPVSPALGWYAESKGRDARELVLGESDDYELLITCPRENVAQVRSAVASVGGVPVAEIGRLIASPGRGELLLPGGERRELRFGGWDHFGADRPEK